MLNQIKYLSTRGGESSLSYEDVLLSGLARDGGLFMPEEWPRFSLSDLNDMKGLSYAELACKIMSPFIPFLTNECLAKFKEIEIDNWPVVNKDLPGNCIVGGSPAKVIREIDDKFIDEEIDRVKNGT
mgnify:CR=1 FL=1